MVHPTRLQLPTFLSQPTLPESSKAQWFNQIRNSQARSAVCASLRAATPTLDLIPQTNYSLYRQFTRSGDRSGYERPYFAKRSMLTRAVVEMIFDETSNSPWRDIIHDLVWNICEETSWVLPAHEDLSLGFISSGKLGEWYGGTSTSLTREPDNIDLFAAETGASLAEAIYLLADQLDPEVVQRARQEIDRRIFRPYLAYGRKFWWHRGDLNWNAVCNGAVGLTFMRLEHDPHRLAGAIALVLEGFEAYTATGFEADGGSLEGIGYWDYGLMYYVALAEVLYEHSGGQFDLLSSERMKEIARYPLAIALAPGKYFSFADADERATLQPGITQRLADRTGVSELAGLIIPSDDQAQRGSNVAKLAIILRDLAWWDGKYRPFPAVIHEDAYLPACALVKLTGQDLQGQTITLAAKAGVNTGHHFHMDIGHFIFAVNGEDFLCDPGRGLYSKEYFREQRFSNIFCNSYGHSVPRIGGRLQMPGPKFGQGELAQGQIIDLGHMGTEKYVLIDIHPVYGLPELTLARRRLILDEKTGIVRLEDYFEFTDIPLAIEEAFVTWHTVTAKGSVARISANKLVPGEQNAIALSILEPEGAIFRVESLHEECLANRRDGILTRLCALLPQGVQRFVMQISVLS